MRTNNKILAIAVAMVMLLPIALVMSTTSARADLPPNYMYFDLTNPTEGGKFYAGQTCEVSWVPYTSYVSGSAYFSYLTITVCKVGHNGLGTAKELYAEWTGENGRKITSFLWNIPSDQASGSYVINVTWGSSGLYTQHVGTTTISIAKAPSDHTPPGITFPSADWIWNSWMTPNINVGLKDLKSGVDMGSLIVTIDHRSVKAIKDGNGFHYPTALLSKGKHTMVVSVMDNAGNKATGSWTFTKL